ncbi:MAG: hypothetical protein FJ403_07010 [Verrucomicrobia bacterium]|nr:hypothetical protein [Verrucomicrobiota bacterium]
MKLSNLEAALNRRPFRPFEIRADAGVIIVRHPGQTMFAEGKTAVVIADQEDHLHIMDVDQISKMRILPQRRSASINGQS